MARILIVEDDDSVRTFTARALQIDGHSVEQADDGDIGLEKVIEKRGGYDLVLSDIRMPTMDGISMAREIAKDFPDQRILLMTGYAEQRERARDVEKIVVDVVQKPFTLADIRTAVARALTGQA
ncbi:response regulator [Oricola thermophila]|uniref:Response regulator n=1 Tax=Oricola thermophila TaxID=2742145 RepID=A0A6N1VH27_9HYPH|nr:response regulator [Oricola thermophila]QKV20124.1 response regulator [Oricola thermophila]